MLKRSKIISDKLKYNPRRTTYGKIRTEHTDMRKETLDKILERC